MTKISGKIDRIFDQANFPTLDYPSPTQAITPSAAVADLYNRKLYLLLMSIRDPFSGTFSNKMLAWNEQDWSIVSQSVSLSFIGTQEINSDIVAWGTDGKSLYPLMQTPSSALTKTWSTKLYGAGQAYIITKLCRTVYMQAENFADITRAPAFTVIIDTEYMSLQVGANPAIAFPPPDVVLPSMAAPPMVQCPLLMLATGDIPGQQIGLTIRTTEPDHAIYNIMLATEDIGAIFG